MYVQVVELYEVGLGGEFQVVAQITGAVGDQVIGAWGDGWSNWAIVDVG